MGGAWAHKCGHGCIQLVQVCAYQSQCVCTSRQELMPVAMAMHGVKTSH